ncbi:U-box domain-containing protein 42 [Musa troglodytarum]|uniref:RING-type E3 ubiquitin transferase n=1 Tax=Musa troglodytarum TaxID=320322 RepID=A0A9E7JTY9_9LILI|nr:U-box domain-containing protein 42 [Musa troglodytarum]
MSVKDQKVVVVESLLAAISEIMSSVASVEIEHQTFMELGCYLHRISPVIMEFQTIENGSPSAFQILQSLSAKVKLANNLVVKCSTGAKSIRDDDLKFITEELEEVIRKLGQDLSTIPLSTFQNKKYAEIAVQSLSREMKNVCFHINGTGNCITEERKLENSSVEQLVKRKDADIVPSSDEKNKLHSTWSGYMPRLGDFLEGIDSDAWKYARGSIETLSQIAEYSEPLYDTFFCPITKRIMDDPVTIESGITFERKAIAEWFGRFKNVSETITCPATGIKLQSRVLNSNMALRTIIAEWKRRNEVKRIKVAHNVLLLDKSEAMVLDAIRDLNILSQKRRYNRGEMHNLGITKLLTSFLEHKNMMVWTEALKLLRLLVEDEEGKVIVANTNALERTTEMLSSNNASVRHESIAFLLELSETETLMENIGYTAGCILTLITMKYNESAGSLAAEKAEKILKNLEKYPRNIKSMAEYGYLEPLLDHLISGGGEEEAVAVHQGYAAVTGEKRVCGCDLRGGGEERRGGDPLDGRRRLRKRRGRFVVGNKGRERKSINDSGGEESDDCRTTVVVSEREGEDSLLAKGGGNGNLLTATEGKLSPVEAEEARGKRRSHIGYVSGNSSSANHKLQVSIHQGLDDKGTEEVQIEMASYLSELILEHDMKTYVAEKASKVLIKIVTTTRTIITQRAAFGALVQISSHPLNNQMLVNDGIIPILIEEMFTCGIYNTYIDFKEQAATILANIAKSTTDLETIQVDKHGHTITSHYSIYNIAHMLKCSKSDNLNINLINILLYMAKNPRHIATVVSVIKETEVSYTLIEQLNSPVEVLVVAAAKLLTALSSHIGHSIAEGLCKTKGQPEGLIKSYDIDQITKKHAMSVNLIAKLPHKNLTLNLSLLHRGTVPAIISRMQGILRGETRTTRYTRCYLEGLVGVLVRFTATLVDQEILQMARGQNLTSVFTELLVRTAGSNEVQRLAAAALENLSSQSVHLSRPPEVPIPSRRRFSSKTFSSSSQEAKKSQRVQLCPVHKGACSSSTTFCLLESGAVERLLGCLEQKNPEVVEAALSAIGTLLDEMVDVEESVRVLGEGDALSFVLGALREHREEGVRQKCFLVIERFLTSGGDSVVGEIADDRMVRAALVTAVHKGSGSTKKMAENILRYLNNVLD